MSFNLEKTKISKWMRNKKSIIQAASDHKKKNIFTIRSAPKNKRLYRALQAKFNDARSKSNHVDCNWLWSKGCKEMKRLIWDIIWSREILNATNKQKNTQRALSKCDREIAFQFARKSYSNWSCRYWLWQDVGKIKSNFCFNIDQSPPFFCQKCNKDLRGGKIGSTSENLNKKTWMSQTGDSKKVLHLECMLSPVWITTEACYNL